MYDPSDALDRMNGQSVECRERASDQGRLEAIDDKDKARTPLVIGPSGHMHGWMNKMLDAMYGDGTILSDKVQNTFDPQHFVAVSIEQHRQPDAKGRPVERFVNGKAEGTNAIAMSIVIAMRMI
jgi:hypothetical protein